MYWPTTASRALDIPSPLDREALLASRPSRRGNFFAVLTKDGLGVWDVRPTVLQAVVVRTPASLERFGENVNVFWSSDGRGLIILTSSSHLLVYQLASTGQPVYDLPANSSFPPVVGPGEGDFVLGWNIRALGAAFIMGGCTSILPQTHSLHLTLRHPPSILTVPWPLPQQLLSPPGSHFPPAPLDGDGHDQVDCQHWDLTRGLGWMISERDTPSVPTSFAITRTQGLPTLHTMLTEDGRVYAMYISTQLAQLNLTPHSGPSTPVSRVSPSHLPPHQISSTSSYFSQPFSAERYSGQIIYPPPISNSNEVANGTKALGLVEEKKAIPALETSEKASEIAFNGRFGLIAVGTAGGIVEIISVPPYPQVPRHSHSLNLKDSANLRLHPGSVQSLAWTSDGYALAVGYEKAWAVWSMGGRLGGWGMAGSKDAGESNEPAEAFMHGVKQLFWAPGNLDLFVLSDRRTDASDEENGEQLHIIPFAKSATTNQHSPDNTRYAFLQLDDRVMVYRGADQPDMSVINPESDVWQNIKIPSAYISTNWPIRYASISSDGKLIAVAGRRGLTHYSSASGRWKLFEDERQEREFTVRGGLLWFHHVLIAGVDVDKSHQIRLYSRDADLSDQHILHSQSLPAPILVMSLLDNSLLVYTADNTLYHFLILPTRDSIRLHLCGSISFLGIIQVPSRVRALSWLIPQAQKDLGDPADDLVVATIIFLVDGRLVLLRPRRAGNDEVRYDMQILADRIESYWTHLHGVGTLENSLWGYDGSGMRVWLDALTIEATRVDSIKDAYETVKESVYLRLDFYPLSILMDKGIIIGVDYETSTRSLPFVLFKIQTSTHLFLPQFLRYHLSQHNITSALIFASNYSSIVYYAHSLEVLLHSVLEDEVDTGLDILPLVIEFLDHFPESLDVVVGCARKTEVERWSLLFDVVGKPRDLFEKCLQGGMLKTAAGYLLVLQNLEELDDVKDTVRLLTLAMAAKEYHLCKEVLRFLHSIDDTGTALRKAIEDVGIIPSSPDPESPPPPPSVSPPHTIILPPYNTSTPSPLPTPGSDGSSTRPPRPMDRSSHLRTASAGRINSPFELSSPRLWTTPPSPRTTDVVPDQPTPLSPQLTSPPEETQHH